MKKINNSLLTLTMTLTMCGTVMASSPGTHIYVGKQTFEVWADYDLDFS